MKPTKLDDVPGATKEDKLAHLLAQYPLLHIQEKFNGIGFRAQRRRGALHIYTTRNNTWPAGFFGEDMERALTQVLFNLPVESCTIYGEFVAAQVGVHLATLAGALNCKSAACDPRVPIKAVVYDVDPGYAQTYLGRSCLLLQRFPHNKLLHLPAVRATHEVAKITTQYHEIVDAGGEGIIIRADPCYFCAGISPMMWKWKRLHDMEGICVAVKEGEGKRKGMLGAMLIRFPGCDEPVWVGGGAGLTDDVLRLLWTNPPIDQQMTVTYEETSINGTPLRPQLVCPRNYE